MGLLKIPFFRLGEWKHPKYGTIKGTPDKFKQFTDNFKGNALGRPPFIRIGHDKSDSPTFGDAEAKAWIKDIVQEGNVLYALCEPCDENVENLIKSKKYRFASAEYDDNYHEKTTGKNVGTVLSAIALTNEPFLTHLPENVVLSDINNNEFYLDFEEREGNKMDEFFKKLSEFFTTLTAKMKLSDEPAKPKKEDEPAKDEDVNAKLLAEFETMKQELADIKSTNTNLLSDNENIKKSNEEKEIEMKLSEMKLKGIPPVLCDKAKEMLLAMPASSTIKLADNSEKKLSDMVYEMLSSLPEASRVKYDQFGSQQSQKTGEGDDDYKKLADEDIKALGGKVTEDGKYIL
jgi:hypothetical protein